MSASYGDGAEREHVGAAVGGIAADDLGRLIGEASAGTRCGASPSRLRALRQSTMHGPSGRLAIASGHRLRWRARACARNGGSPRRPASSVSTIGTPSRPSLREEAREARPSISSVAIHGRPSRSSPHSYTRGTPEWRSTSRMQASRVSSAPSTGVLANAGAHRGDASPSGQQGVFGAPRKEARLRADFALDDVVANPRTGPQPVRGSHLEKMGHSTCLSQALVAPLR